jgi:hypothetical protein
VEIQSARILAQALMSGLSQSPQAQPLDETQAARFQALLQSHDGAAEATSVPGSDLASGAITIGRGDTLAAESAAAAPTSLGDSILRGLTQVRGSLNEGLAQANRLIDPQAGPLSTAKLLQFQVGMLNMGFQYQLIASVVTKTAQNIDQLVKMQ